MTEKYARSLANKIFEIGFFSTEILYDKYRHNLPNLSNIIGTACFLEISKRDCSKVIPCICLFNTGDDAGLPVNNIGFHSPERPISRKIARIFPKMVSTDFAANVLLQPQPLSHGIPRKEQVSICNCVRPDCSLNIKNFLMS